MTVKRPSFLTRWMISPLEIIAIVAFILLAAGGIFASVQDALQLEDALNRDLTQTVILNQGIVNLQREIQLTRVDATRLLGKLDNPPSPLTRFVFAEIQVNNLVRVTKGTSSVYILDQDDLALIHDLETRSVLIKRLINDTENATSPEQRTATLRALDDQLKAMEATIKQLVDHQSDRERLEITRTRDSLRTSQFTSLLAVIVLLLMAIALAFVFRRTLSARLEQAMEADRLKSHLMTSVSHELRTPINAIQGYSQLLVEDAYGVLSTEQRTTIRRILLNTTQLQGMVNNLLDRAQIEQGKLTLRNAPFSPVDLIETTHAALNILATAKGLELSSKIAPDVPEMIIGDVLRLQQILFNLTSNALKFTEKGSVQARIFLPDATHWALQVTDTGIGIPPDAQEYIFSPFWQLDSSATREYRGSGLGLSIVKQLTDLMGGRIILTSQPGKGSDFIIIFPLEKIANE